MKRFVKELIKGIIALIFLPLKHVIPKGKVIILQTYSPYIYCENTKYLYEYLSEHTDYDVYWVTESEEIKRYLDGKGYKYITNKRIVQLIWIALKARIVIDTGSMYFNKFNLIGPKTVKISTLHGNGPKATLATYETLAENINEICKVNKFDFVNFTSQYSAAIIGKKTFRLPPYKLKWLGYPRCDHFFKDDFVGECYGMKKTAKSLNNQVVTDGKIMLYTPTWRPYEYEFPLLSMPGFEVQEFDDFLKKNNIFFFYTSHSVNRPNNILPETDNIRYVTHKDNPFFDINIFMPEVDILLNDYSTTSTEFALLKRPQIFFMPDYEYYNLEKGFCEDYKAILPGKEVFNFDEFKETMSVCLNNRETYLKEHEIRRKQLLERYYDISLSNSCELFSEFISKIMSKK